MLMAKKVHYIIIISITLFILTLSKTISKITKTKTKEPPKKPSIYSFSPIDIEFKTVGLIPKIKKSELNKINRYIDSVKTLLKRLIYVNFKKKSIKLDKKVLENFEILYTKDEPFIQKEENISKHLVVLINYKKMRKRLFYSYIYKENKSSMYSGSSSHCYLGLIKINTLAYKDYIKFPNHFKMSINVLVFSHF